MIQLRGDRVLVALPPAPEQVTTASGIVLVRDPDRAKVPTQGIVVQLGEKSGTVSLDDLVALLNEHCECGAMELVAAIKSLGPAPFDVQVGDCVLFPLAAGDELELDHVTYVILRESDILGVVDPLKEAV